MPAVLDRCDAWVRAARRRRAVHLAIVNLRFLVGFAFVPAGLKKVAGQPFTDPGNHGAFHDFLHAFHATGFFYRFVGIVQLAAAALLITQRFAGAGAALALPVIAAITVFCWSTAVYPTATVATLMLAGTLAILAWELPRWRARGGPLEPPPLDPRLWQACGVAILALYLALCAVTGEIYRPRRGFEPGEVGSYALVVIAALPVVTFVIDQRRR